MEFDIIAMLREVVGNLQAGPLLAICTVLYIFIQILRGKVVLGGKPIKIPWLTDKFNALQKEAKTYIILGLFGIIGIVTGLTDDQVTFWSVLDSFLVGILTGSVVIGVRNVAKQGISGTKKFVDQIKANRKS